MEKQIIKPIIGYEEFYLIASDGNIYSKRKWRGVEMRILKTSPDKYGYTRVFLTKNGKTTGIKVHKLMAINFMGEKPKEMQVRHLDGNKNNNEINNLKYGTALENANDRFLHGKTATGEKIGSAKLSNVQVSEIRSKYKKRGDMVKLAKEYSVSCSNIYQIIKKTSRKNG